MSQLHAVSFHVGEGKANHPVKLGNSALDWEAESIRKAAVSIAHMGPDLLALQGVRDRVKSGPLLSEFVAAGNFEDVLFLPQRSVLAAKCAERHGKHLTGVGVALASRYRIRRARLLSLPESDDEGKLDAVLAIFAPASRVHVAILAQVEAPGRDIFVATTCLSRQKALRALQLTFVRQQLDDFAVAYGGPGAPRAILGSLGMPVAELRGALATPNVTELPTTPIEHPTLVTDYFVGSAVRFSSLETQVLPVSDHRALRGNLIF